MERTPGGALLALTLLTCAVLAAVEEEGVKTLNRHFLARGWGNDITWVRNYEEGLTKMRQSWKPLMVIHHKEDCPYSKELKKTFSADKSIQKMAKEDFIMLNIVHETQDRNLAPDGYYVPRILFVDPSMTVRADLTGKYTNRLYAYEPKDSAYLVENMVKAKIFLRVDHPEL